MTTSRPLDPDEPVIVTMRSGERHGVVIERWFGPVTGDSYVVAIDGGMVIAPAAHVRRPSESEEHA